jgi:hypothetical protein
MGIARMTVVFFVVDIDLIVCGYIVASFGLLVDKYSETRDCNSVEKKRFTLLLVSGNGYGSTSAIVPPAAAWSGALPEL